MFKYASTALLVWLLTSGFVSTAHAVACGDSVTTSITLTSDLHCTSGYAALEVFANDVTIDLNGYTLSGTSGLAGVQVQGYKNVTVTNGSMRGFFAGVNANQSTALRVNNVLFYEVGFGVVNNAGNDAAISKNQFVRAQIGVSMRNSLIHTSASNNLIDDNEFYQAGIGINICGDHADNNTITHNLIWKTIDYGIQLTQSDKTTIANNRILETGSTAIRLSNSSRSDIQRNTLAEGDTGLSILAQATSPCLVSGAKRSYKNVIAANSVMAFQTGVRLGLGLTNSDEVLRNTLIDNKIYDDGVGIYFASDAHDNTTSNAFQGTFTPIVDYGVDNSY
ncbi:MAG: NosD domain-containing protein [Gammaproteobacteria bacterium]